MFVRSLSPHDFHVFSLSSQLKTANYMKPKPSTGNSKLTSQESLTQFMTDLQDSQNIILPTDIVIENSAKLQTFTTFGMHNEIGLTRTARFNVYGC